MYTHHVIFAVCFTKFSLLVRPSVDCTVSKNHRYVLLQRIMGQPFTCETVTSLLTDA